MKTFIIFAAYLLIAAVFFPQDKFIWFLFLGAIAYSIHVLCVKLETRLRGIEKH